jgi:hypothetical protein
LLSEFAVWMRGRWQRPGFWQALALAGLSLLAGAWAWVDLPAALPSRNDILLALRQPLNGSYLLSDTERYILQNSAPDQTVLVWSIHPSINWITGRRSPSPYLYPLHLIWPAGDNRQRFQRMLAALESDPPVLVLDQKKSPVGIPPLTPGQGDPCPGCTADVRQGFLALRDFVQQHYTVAREIDEWIIYRYNP